MQTPDLASSWLEGWRLFGQLPEMNARSGLAVPSLVGQGPENCVGYQSQVRVLHCEESWLGQPNQAHRFGSNLARDQILLGPEWTRFAWLNDWKVMNNNSLLLAHVSACVLQRDIAVETRKT